MAKTLCDGVDAPRMVVTLVKDSQKVLFSQPQVNQILVNNIPINHLLVDLLMGPPINQLLVGKVFVGQPPVMVVPPWHVVIAKLKELLAHLPIDRTGVLPDVVVVQNQEGVFQMGGGGGVGLG
jgi:hypothetical protein